MEHLKNRVKKETVKQRARDREQAWVKEDLRRWEKVLENDPGPATII